MQRRDFANITNILKFKTRHGTTNKVVFLFYSIENIKLYMIQQISAKAVQRARETNEQGQPKGTKDAVS